MDSKQWAVDLQKVGLSKGDHVLVHSSLRALSARSRKAFSLFHALCEVIGSEGSLLVPTLSYTFVTPERPLFKPADTPSSVGGFSAFALMVRGGRRSIHPTHSVWAYGADADSWVHDHQLDTTPVGPHSPFTKLRQRKGKVLFIGCGLRPNTSMHGVEEEMDAPYLYGKEQVYTIEDGARSWQQAYRTHGFEGISQRYERLEAYMPEASIHKGRVGDAPTYLLDAHQMWETAREVLEQDPFALVEKK